MVVDAAAEMVDLGLRGKKGVWDLEVQGVMSVGEAMILGKLGFWKGRRGNQMKCEEGFLVRKFGELGVWHVCLSSYLICWTYGWGMDQWDIRFRSSVYCSLRE